MPNTRPRAILTADDVTWYRHQLLAVGEPNFTPLMTIEIRDNTTPQMIHDAKSAGAIAGKVYPLGVTTNSDEGLRDFFSDNTLETFSAMQETGMLLLIHGELDTGHTLVTQREQSFLPTLHKLASAFPNLKIVLEHVSSIKGIEAVKSLGPNVAATITAHHLCLTLNDVIGHGVCPHNACAPMPKSYEDRAALIAAATSGDPKFFFGSDSAPHAITNKECARGALGLLTAPVVPSVLAEIFEANGALDKLQNFTSKFGAEFYNLPLNQQTITLIKQKWTVPQLYGNIVPFKAGETLNWQLAK